MSPDEKDNLSDTEPLPKAKNETEDWNYLASLAREREAGHTRSPAKPTNPLRRDLSAVQGTVLLLLILVAFVAWGYLKPAQRWEYKIETVADEQFSTEINKLGDDGWEMVFARRASSEVSDITKEKPKFSYEMIFKRPLGRLSSAESR
jgi:hypothetical protein